MTSSHLAPLHFAYTTIQLSCLTTFELHIDEEVDNDNKIIKVVRKVYGTNSPWYE